MVGIPQKTSSPIVLEKLGWEIWSLCTARLALASFIKNRINAIRAITGSLKATSLYSFSFRMSLPFDGTAVGTRVVEGL
jgi:hypothetical protein